MKAREEVQNTICARCNRKIKETKHKSRCRLNQQWYCKKCYLTIKRRINSEREKRRSRYLKGISAEELLEIVNSKL